MDNQETNQQKGKNSGCCLGLVVLVVIAYIAYFFYSTSGEELAENGKFILTVVGLVVAYFGGKYIYNSVNPKSSKWGCALMAALVIGGGIFVNILTMSSHFNYIIGALFSLVLIVGAVIFLFGQSND